MTRWASLFYLRNALLTNVQGDSKNKWEKRVFLEETVFQEPRSSVDPE